MDNEEKRGFSGAEGSENRSERRDGEGYKGYASREANGGERRPFRPRYNNDEQGGERRPFRPRYNNDEQGGERRPFRPRYNDGEQSGENRPYRPRYNNDEQGGERRPFRPRYNDGEQSGENRPYRPRYNNDEQGGERRPFRPRYNDGEQSGENRPYRPRYNNNEQSGESRPFRPRYNNDEQGGERRPFRPRYNDGEQSGESRPFRPRYNEGEQGGERRQFRPRYNEGNQGGERRSFRPRYNEGEQGGERRSFRPRYNEGEQGGERRSFRPRYNEGEQDGERRSFRPRNNEGHQGGERRSFRPRNNERGGNNFGGNKNRRPGQNRPAPRQHWLKSEASIAKNPFRRIDNKLFDNDNEVDVEQNGTDPDMQTMPEKLRLNRYIAMSGVCSRREADELIKKGYIKVNGETVTEMGVTVSSTDTIEYDGKVLKAEKKVYVLLNKPKDAVTTTDDPEGRRTVMDIVANACTERIYPVGRLDRNTTGVLLLTNDGEIAEKLMHPSYEIRKIYHVFLDKEVEEDHLKMIVAGIELEDGPIAADEISFVEHRDHKQVGIAIHSGRNRIVRRIFEHFGYVVERLDRVYYGGLTKLNVPRGHWRYLTDDEVNRLKAGFTK